jgi:ubiquinone/menaquinone biosynthesis C-methylase UbiE
MSLRGRRFLDSIKSRFGRYITLPCPPYGLPEYWESAYKSILPEDVIEWSDLDFQNHLFKYQYKFTKNEGNEKVTTTFAEAIRLSPNDTGKSVMILGCGYSKLGEDMVSNGWQKIIQVDIVPKVITDISKRCDPKIQLVKDDATSLSKFKTSSIDAIVDKGLLDSLFIAEERKQMHAIMESAHRVLKPMGTFAVLSLSEPQYLLQALINSNLRGSDAQQLIPLDTQALDSTFLYRFQKPQRVFDKAKSYKSESR